MTNAINREAQSSWINQAMVVIKPFWEVDMNSSKEEIAAIFKEHAFNSKEEYLQWRDQYRALIKQGAELQKAWKAQRKDQESSGTAQCYVANNASYITRLIEARRMSKIAAGVQREAEMKEPQEA